MTTVRPVRLLAGLYALGVLLPALGTTAGGGCGAGRYRMEAGAIDLHDGALSLPGACATAPIKVLHAGRDGVRLRSGWMTCAGGPRRVLARITPGCAEMHGVVRGWHTGDAPHRFHARRVPVCGDARLDPGERCDDGNAVDGDGCSAHCAPEPHPTQRL